jgi:hypothetical protein
MTHKHNEVTSMEVVEAVLRASIAGGTGLLSITHPELVAATAAGAEGAMLLLTQASRKWQSIRAERAVSFVDAVSSRSGLTLSELSSRIDESEQALELIVTGIEASTRTPLMEKIDALAKVVSNGLVASTSEQQSSSKRTLMALSRIDEDHLELLLLLQQRIPGVAEDLGWKEPRIIERLPQVEGVLPALAADLRSYGLIFDNGVGRYDYQPIWKITSLGGECLLLLGRFD